MTADITIIVPSYNRRNYLGLALESALNQTVKDFEVLVVDDGSTDDSVMMVERMQKEDSRLRVLTHSKNKGPSAARNTGIQNCTSKYVTFLDSDDLFSVERIELLRSRIEAGVGPSVIYTDSVSIGAEEVSVRAEQSRAPFRPEGMIFRYLLAGSFRFIAGPIAVPKKCFDVVGVYDESLRWAEDIDVALRLSCKFPFLFDRSCTYGWRLHQSSSENLMGRSQRFRDESRVLEKHILNNLENLDSNTKRKAFDRLFGCYISSGQRRRLLRMSTVDWQAFVSMVTIPARMMGANRPNPTP